MKKLLLCMCAILLSVGVFAQKGESAVGINLNATPCLESGASLTNFGVAAKYQYGISNPIRVEAVVGYDFKAKGMSVLEAGVNGHWLFSVAKKFTIYPLIGVGYANLSASDGGTYETTGFNPSTGKLTYGKIEDEDSSSASKVYFNVGAGAEYALSDRFGVNFEIKYQYIKDFTRLPVSLGLSYKF